MPIGIGGTCCCPTGVPCTACAGGLAPENFKLTIAGLSRGTGIFAPCWWPCECCDNGNGEFILTGPQYYCPGLSGDCGWVYHTDYMEPEFPDVCCDDAWMCWYAVFNGLTLTVAVESQLLAAIAVYKKTYESVPNCRAFNNEAIPLFQSLSQCCQSDGTPALLTAI